MEVVNLFGDEWDGDRDRPGWQWRSLQVGRRLGTELFGGTLYELSPGQRTFPHHYHYGTEELLVVLGGEPTLRGPEGEQRLRPGDCVGFRRGPEGAHQLRNDTDEPCRLLILSAPADLGHDVVRYPDSGKAGAMARLPGREPFRLMVREESSVDYFEGED